MVQLGRRERKKAEARQHISHVATELFAQRGYDAVSVSEIAEAADVARPTVFAYFPRKEDLVFDRTEAVTTAIVEAVRGSDAPPVHAMRDLLVAPAAPGAFGARLSDQQRFWELVASSRALKARARELAEEMESALATALRDRGLHEPALCAAFIAAGYRSVHLRAIRRILAGEPPEDVETERTSQLAAAFNSIEHAVACLQETTDPSGEV